MLSLVLLAFVAACGSKTSPYEKHTTTTNINPTSQNNMSIELIHGTGTPTHAIIWLHGLGASASDFPPVVEHLGLNDTSTIRFIFPQAPDRPITVNNGMVMPGWYDIKGLEMKDKHDRQGTEQSRATVEKFIQAQIEQGIPSENIILAGFSQGGAIGYYTALRTEHRLAGVLALSTYLLFPEESAAEQSEVNRGIPVFASHGTQDPVVPISLGEQSAEKVKNLGYNVDWKTYPMEHQVVMEQIKDIGDWINRIFDS